MERQTVSMPMVALRGMTIMPEMVVHFDCSRAKSKEAVQKAMQSKEQRIFLVAQREVGIEDPGKDDVFEIGTVAVIKQVAKMNKTVIRVLVTGEQRARLVSLTSEDPYMEAEVEYLEDHNDFEPESLTDCPEAKALQEIFFEYAIKGNKVPKDVVSQIADVKTFQDLVTKVAANIPLDFMNLQEILEEDDLYKRYNLLAFKLTNEMAVISLKDDIQTKVKERMEKHQKEFILREQMKVIREELGEENTVSDAEEFEAAVKELNTKL